MKINRNSLQLMYESYETGGDSLAGGAVANIESWRLYLLAWR